MRAMNKIFLVIVMMTTALTACAQGSSGSYTEGVHYKRLATTLFTSNPRKVEVVEFFSYGCGHCYSFEPLVQRWKKDLPEQTVFQYSPAVFNARMVPLAKAYYVAKALGVVDQVHPKMFTAIHVERKPMATQADVRNVFVSSGVDGEKFDNAYRSFAVNGQVRQAESRLRGAKVTGTPMLMVNGKYTIDVNDVGGQANMLKVATYLVNKELASK